MESETQSNEEFMFHVLRELELALKDAYALMAEVQSLKDEIAKLDEELKKCTCGRHNPYDVHRFGELE